MTDHFDPQNIEHLEPLAKALMEEATKLATAITDGYADQTEPGMRNFNIAANAAGIAIRSILMLVPDRADGDAENDHVNERISAALSASLLNHLATTYCCDAHTVMELGHINNHVLTRLPQVLAAAGRAATTTRH